MNKNKLLMYFFVGSESFFFLSLIISYIYFNHTGNAPFNSSQYLDAKRTLIFTIALIMSSATIFLADHYLGRMKRKTFQGWLGLTIILGVIFLVGQATEYIRLYHLNFTISKNVFGSAFFTLTGFHGLHVFFGVVILSVVFGMFLSKKFKPIETTALKTASIYWHFVDAVWVVVFSVVYLGLLK